MAVLLPSIHANLDVQLARSVGLHGYLLRHDVGYWRQSCVVELITNVHAHLAFILLVFLFEVVVGCGVGTCRFDKYIVPVNIDHGYGIFAPSTI